MEITYKDYFNRTHQGFGNLVEEALQTYSEDTIYAIQDKSRKIQNILSSLLETLTEKGVLKAADLENIFGVREIQLTK